MKWKRNIYDADDAARSKRLKFTPEERAENAKKKAEVLGGKLEQAKQDLPKQRRPALKRTVDPATGKVKHSVYLAEEVKPRGKRSTAGRVVTASGRMANRQLHRKLRQVEQENVGTEAAHKTEFVTERTVSSAVRHGHRYVKDTPYRKVEKLERKSTKATVEARYREAIRDTPELQEHTFKAQLQKRRMKRKYAKELRKAQQAAGGATVWERAKNAVTGAAQTASDFIVQHQKGALCMASILALMVCLLMSGLSSCSAMLEGVTGAITSTSYTAEDPDIRQTESDYTALEKQLERELGSIEQTYSGYDEYRYDVDTIGHDPNELIAYLTVKFNDFKPDEVQAALKDLFEQQYTVTLTPVSETRYKTVSHTNKDGTTSSRRVAYTYKILYVTVRNRSLGTVVRELLTEDEYKRYLVIFQQKGNRPDIFGDNIYANPSEGPKYEIPGEALSDPSFKALITEAEKYLGYPYVWGGSSPSTSFDCSGFVCWVYTASGVHNLPRTTATGIYNQCTVISKSEAKPGDLVFFTKTYDCDGPVSHIGIYVGNGMMIHAGSPIKYASIETSYWQKHFYAFGRL